MSAMASDLRAARRRLPAFAGALALLAGTLAAADPPPAPPSLDQLKNDLQAAQRAADAAGDGSASLAKVALPALHATPDTPAEAPATPAGGPTPLIPGGNQAATQANWLVDAMLPPETNAAGNRSDTGTRDATADPRTAKDASANPGSRAPDPSGANFLLNVYLSQTKAAGSRTSPASAWTPDAAAAGDLGSFSRFLGDWVSPRDTALHGLIAAASPETPGSLPASGQRETRPDPADLTSATPVNPYLEALAPDLAPAVSAMRPAPLPAVPSLETPAPAPGAAPPPANLPPPNPADEKKYFPQLNRF